ncbi:transposable element Tcb2 transposase [Trichonephila clavipes]|nr:transposable element Tcb2 transposase [Trichonephila clavipes]
MERHSGLTPGVMIWSAISYHGRSNLLGIEDNLNSNSPTHATSSLACYLTDMSPIEHVWDWVGRRLARDPRPAASKDELLLRMQAIWNSLPQADIQNLFYSMPRRIEALIANRLRKQNDNSAEDVHQGSSQNISERMVRPTIDRMAYGSISTVRAPLYQQAR